jgi:hypothetical protein
MELNGQSMEFGLLDATPKSLFGEYIVAQAQGAIIGGVGVLTATKVGFPDLALKISLQFARGFGINLGVNTMHIKLIE